MASIHERIHNVKEKLRKKGCNIEFYIPELLKIDEEIKRAVKKRLHDPSYEFRFSAGDLRIIATTIKTKVNNLTKKLYYDTYGFEPEEMVKDGQIDWNDYEKLSSKKAEELKLLQKLVNLHYMYSHTVFTIETLELYIKLQIEEMNKPDVLEIDLSDTLALV